MKARKLLKRGVFLVSFLVLLLSFNNLAYAAKEDSVHMINQNCMRWVYYGLNLFGDSELAIHTGDEISLYITYPVDGSYVAGTVNIAGTTYAEEEEMFDSYQLYYAPKDDPDNKQPIGDLSTVRVQDDLLGEWDTTLCPDGEYILTLKFFTTEGDFECFVNYVIVANVSSAPAIETWQITDLPGDENHPAIYGDKIVWTDPRVPGNYYDIYMYDLFVNNERAITNDATLQLYPDIYEDKIVWYEYVGAYTDIYMYDLTTGTKEQITSAINNQLHPAIYEDKIVWQDYRHGNSVIYMYNLTTHQEIRITSDTTGQCMPDIHDNKVVWHDWRNGNADIYMRDLSTIFDRRITTNSANQMSATIHKDKIVWLDERHGGYDIYMYDLSTDEERRITNETAATWLCLSVYEDRIIWNEARGAIHLYDISTDQTIKLTDDSIAVWTHDMYQDKIAWSREHSASNYDIYLTRVVFPPQIISIDPVVAVRGGTLTITGKNFNYTQDGPSQVLFDNGAVCSIINWSNTEITCTVPGNAQTGYVKVHNLAGESNGILATVLSSAALLTADLNGNGLGDIVADFGTGSGIWVGYDNGVWENIYDQSAESTVIADINADGKDEIIFDFGASKNYIWVKYETYWENIYGMGTEQMVTVDSNGNGRKDTLIVDFGEPHGLYLLNNATGVWENICSISPINMIVGDLDGNNIDDLIIDFGASHNYVWVRYDNGTWGNIYGISPDFMITAELDTDNKADLILDFGPSRNGVWILYGDGTLANLYPESPNSITVGKLNANIQDDLIMDLGPSKGLWVSYDNNASFPNIHGLSPVSITTGDLNGNGQDEVIAYFGPEKGIWVYYDGTTWQHLHSE